MVYRDPKRDLILLVIESVSKTTSIELPSELIMLDGQIEASLSRREQSSYSFDVRHSGFLSFVVIPGNWLLNPAVSQF